jgi:glycosyltransferase involved in cell wall biosynthesis
VLTSVGPAEAELRARVDALGIGDRVSFLGYVSDEELIRLYHLASIFAIPSEADLQSLSTMEAMATGLPIVAADAYALPELVHHEVNGFLFEPGNSDEMATQLDALLSNSALRQSMGAKSLEIIAPHARALILRQWEELYQRLSKEFNDARERKLQKRIARRLSSQRPKKQASKRKARRVDLALDKGLLRDE